MVSSSSIIYKMGDDEIFTEDVEENIDDTSSEVLVTIQNNIVDLHNVTCYILLALGMLIGVGVIKCLNR